MYKSIDDYNKLIQNRKLILIDDHDIKYSNIKMNKTNRFFRLVLSKRMWQPGISKH